MAAQGGHVEVVKLLVDSGADLFVAVGETGTALNIAVANRRTEVVRFLSARMQSIQPSVSRSHSFPRHTTVAAPSEATVLSDRVQYTSMLEDILCCPITLDIMDHPVVAADGHTYERAAITEWIARNGKSPVTQQPLAVETLVPNLSIKHQIEIYRQNLRE